MGEKYDIYDSIAEGFIEKNDSVRGLFAKPSIPKPKKKYAFTEYLGEKEKKKPPTAQEFLASQQRTFTPEGQPSYGAGGTMPGLTAIQEQALKEGKLFSPASRGEALMGLLTGKMDLEGGPQEYTEWQTPGFRLPTPDVPSPDLLTRLLSGRGVDVKGAAEFGLDVLTDPLMFLAAPKAGQVVAKAGSKVIQEAKPVARELALGQAGGVGKRVNKVAKAVTPEVAKVAKEPWQMTREEFLAAMGEEPGPIARGLRPPTGPTVTENTAFHKRLVQEAVSEGKPVPPEVLKDYPDLAKVAPVPGVQRVTPSPEVAGAALPQAKPFDQNWGAQLKEKIAILDSRGTATDSDYHGLLSTSGKFGKGNIKTWREYAIKLADRSLSKTPLEGEVPQGAFGARGVSLSKVEPPTVQTPTEMTSQLKAIQQKGLQALPEEAKLSHIELAAPDGPRLPPPPRGTAKGIPPPDEPSKIMREIAAKTTPGDRPDQTLLRLHEAAINNEQRRVNIAIWEGSNKLKAQGIGVARRGQLVAKPRDLPVLDELYNALHNPRKVASGEVKVPKGFEDVYQELRGLTDWEQAARLDFDPLMATVDDYFYRGWKPPEGAFAGVGQGRPLVKTPAFKKPRVDATYQEMREAGFEPLSWNPYQQWGISRLQGTRYREQMELVAHFKGMGDELIKPHTGGPLPKGWRTPEVGPAFEGKPVAVPDPTTGEPMLVYTRRWVVPDNVANSLENIYGKPPQLGKLAIGKMEIDPLSVIDWLTFVPKRIKLFASAFQQVDFLNRSGAGSWTMLADSMLAGKPVTGLKALAKYPVSVKGILQSNFSPAYRQSLARQLDSTVPLVQGRPAINLKGVSEAGLSTMDVTILPKDMDKLVHQVAIETGALGKMGQAVGDLESAMRRGLFEGVYRAAMITDIKNNIAPMVVRMYPKLNDAQLNGMIAKIANVKYSTIPASQSVIQNRVVRETLRRVFFSIGESEGLLRQAAGAFAGPQAAFWRKHWLGTYLFLIATANVIHFASTGEPLPADRYVPISKNEWGPLPIGYNARFAAPTIPIKGESGEEITADIVGQMDTALRLLDPGFFLQARQSVPIRAFGNQISGRNFFGAPIDKVGPGGILSRTAQLAQDMFAPIGSAGPIEIMRQNVPGMEDVIAPGERKLGNVGMMVQSTGVNLRAVSYREKWEDDFKDYLAIPSNDIELKAAQKTNRALVSRDEYRKKNPDLEAKLFISGQIDTIHKAARSEAYGIIRGAVNETYDLIVENKIDPMTIRGIQKNLEKTERYLKAGLKDTSEVTGTDKLVDKLIGAGLIKVRGTQPAKITTPPVVQAPTQPSVVTPQKTNPNADKWNQVNADLTVREREVLQKLWYGGGTLAPGEGNILAGIYNRHGQNQPIDSWVKTLKQYYESSLG